MKTSTVAENEVIIEGIDLHSDFPWSQFKSLGMKPRLLIKYLESVKEKSET